MRRKHLIYAAVVATFGLAVIAVFLFLRGDAGGSVGAGVVAVALAAATSRGQAIEAADQAAEDLAEVDDTSSVSHLDAANEEVESTKEAFAAAAGAVEGLTPEEKIALLEGMEESDG